MPNCKRCHAPSPGSKKNGKPYLYCAECRARYAARYTPREAIAGRTCAWCDAGIDPSKPSSTRYCSSRCLTIAKDDAKRIPCSAGCGSLLWIGSTSLDNPVCRPCRKAARGCTADSSIHNCKCEACTQAHRDGTSRANRRYREQHGEARSTTWRRINGRPERNGSVFEPSTARRLSLYERDNWTCGICGEPTSRVYTSADPWSPTLDHIEPRSHVLIPDHSDAGVRTAHALCNAMRGDDATRDQDVRSRVLPMLYQGLGDFTPPLP